MAAKFFEKNAYYIVFCLALLPILVLRDFTPTNELRYLSIADEALRNHTFFSFTNHGEPYTDKPPLYLWFVMLSKWLFNSHQMLFLSLVSLIPAIAIVKIMDKWTEPELGENNRNIAGMMLLTSAFFTGLAVTLRMDMLMCLFIVLALRSFYQMATTPQLDKKASWLFPIYIFLAIFTKGPVGLLVPLCSTVVFLLWTRKIKQIGKYWGWRTWGVLLVGCIIWFSAVFLEGGKDYLNNLLFHQTLDRAVNSFRHQEPFYYYCKTIWYSLAPWSFLVVGLLVAALGKRLILTQLQRFYCTVALTTFIVLSLISSKLEIYMLPAFPFMVYLAVLYLPRFKDKVWINILFAIPAALFVIVLPTVIFLSLFSDLTYLRHWAVYAAAAILAASGLMALHNISRLQKDVYVGIRMLAIGFTCTLYMLGWALPSINPWIGYKDLCQTAQNIAERKETTNFAAWNVRRAENIDVYLGNPVQIIPDSEEAKTHLLHNTVLMLPVSHLSSFEIKESWTVGKYAVIFLE